MVGSARWDTRLADARLTGVFTGVDAGRWAAAVDPYSGGAWERRLRWGGFDLGPPAGDVPPTASRWVRVRPTMDSDHFSSGTGEPFGHVFVEVVADAWLHVREAAHLAGLSDSAQEQLRTQLVARLSEAASVSLAQQFTGERTLVEVALACVREGRAPGASSRSYARFCADQASSGLGPLFMEFPVLERVLGTIVDHWVGAALELLGRLHRDREMLASTFGTDVAAPVESLSLGLSDPHRGGRGVVIITFADGTSVVYKPRSVEIESRFSHLTAALGEQFEGAPWRSLTVLDLGDHGYMEFLAWCPAADANELTRFYRNAGRLLGLLHVLGATDCHWENLIATGDQLTLVDAETLLEGTPADSADDERDGPRPALNASLAASVLRTGMLPVWISVGGDQTFDISALGAASAPISTRPRPSWCFVNTDDMVLGERDAETPHPTCLPVGRGRTNPLDGHATELTEGFADMCRLLTRPDIRRRTREMIAGFRGAPRRIVVRPTRTYVLLQREALQPVALRDDDERGIRLDRLSRAYTGTDTMPRTWPLLNHEIAAMEDLDVPYAGNRVGSHDLFVGDEMVVAGYYESNGLQDALLRLDGLTEAETSWQIRLVEGSLAAHRFEMSAGPVGTTPPPPVPSREDNGTQPSEIADALVAAMIEDPSGPPTWLTVSLLMDATRVQLGLPTPGLYDGRAGIAAFLYDCDRTDLADSILAPVLEEVDHADAEVRRRFVANIGMGLSGVGGILRLLQYLRDGGVNAGVWRDRTDRIIDVLYDDLVESEPAADLLSGLAGLVAPLAAAYRETGTDRNRQVLMTLARVLRERQHTDGGWPLLPGHPALAGLSHGASGVAVALAELAVVLNDERCSEAAARAARFESGLLDSAIGNWPDLRAGTAFEHRFAMRSWCHGAVGIGLARVRMIELLSDHVDAPTWRAELDLAIDGSLMQPLSSVDHLCCGNVGRAVVAMLSGKACGIEGWVRGGQSVIDQTMSRAGHRADGLHLLLGMNGSCGMRLPGLMTGLAGVGMALHHGSDVRWVRQLLL